MRIPETNPLMTDYEQCYAYNQYVSKNVSQLKEFVFKYRQLIDIKEGTVVDLGSGSCNFIIALAKEFPKLNFLCYEASEEMVAIALKNIRDESLSSRIRILNKDILSATGKYDVVIANRLLHHINDTKQFWKLINSLSENILVIDINRPPPEVIEHIINFDNDYNKKYKEDLINSMKAAYSLDEVLEQVKNYNYTVEADNYYRLFVYHTR